MIDEMLPKQTVHSRKDFSGFRHTVIVALIAGVCASSATLLFFQYGRTNGGQQSLLPEKKAIENRIITLTEESATIDVVQKAAPSVVSISVSKDISKIYSKTGPDIFPFDDFFEFGFPDNFHFDSLQPQQKDGEKEPATKKQRVGGGSGFIISSDGLIVTNKHVVSDEDADYMVALNDGKEYAPKVLARDPINDLAILKIDAQNLPTLELGDSSQIKIGQTVIAIGNSLGQYNNTVTRGVISGINRVVQAADGRGAMEVLQEAIQTDAAINPGNSGGPLLNLTGQVIGINTAVNREGQSIGFAIPIHVVKRSVESVKKFGRIIRPWLGVRYVLIDSEIQKNNNLPIVYGALIIGDLRKKELGVIQGSPAAKAGLIEGDIILSVNNEKIDFSHPLAHVIGKYAPGEEITLRVHSKGKERDATVKLEEFKEQEKK